MWFPLPDTEGSLVSVFQKTFSACLPLISDARETPRTLLSGKPRLLADEVFLTNIVPHTPKD